MKAYSDIKGQMCKLRDGNTRLELLEYLPNQPICVPFSNADAVKKFIDSVDESQAKNECLYKAVRYARMTATALPKTASFFRPNRLPRDC